MARATLSSFLASEDRNAWVYEPGGLSCYLRRARRHSSDGEPRLLKTIDVASVSVDDKKQGRGTFTRFLERVEKARGFDAVYVENVQTQRFSSFFLKRGYALDDPLNNCYIKLANGATL